MNKSIFHNRILHTQTYIAVVSIHLNKSSQPTLKQLFKSYLIFSFNFHFLISWNISLFKTSEKCKSIKFSGEKLFHFLFEVGMFMLPLQFYGTLDKTTCFKFQKQIVIHLTKTLFVFILQMHRQKLYGNFHGTFNASQG